MNHIYRLVWSKRHEKLVAVAETTNSAGKSGSGETMNDAVSLKSGAIDGVKGLKLAASKIAAALIATGCFWGLSAFSYATPVVYFQSFTLGEQYLQNTVNSYANGGTSDFTTVALSGLSAGTSWTVGNVTITATNGVSRNIDTTYRLCCTNRVHRLLGGRFVTKQT